MSKFAAFIFIIALRIVYQPANSQKEYEPFTTPSDHAATISQSLPAKQINSGESITNDFARIDQKENQEGIDQKKIPGIKN